MRKLLLTRRLTTTHRLRVSIRGRLCRIFLTPILITMQKLVVVSHTVRAHVGGPKNLGDAGSTLLGRGVVDALETPYSSPHVLSYRISSL